MEQVGERGRGGVDSQGQEQVCTNRLVYNHTYTHLYVCFYGQVWIFSRVPVVCLLAFYSGVSLFGLYFIDWYGTHTYAHVHTTTFF